MLPSWARVGDRGLYQRDLLVSERLHPFLPRQSGFYEGTKLSCLLCLAPRHLSLELRHHLRREELERLADVRVLVETRLLQKDDLINAGVLKIANVVADVVGRADAVCIALESLGGGDDLIVVLGTGLE